MTKNSNPKQYDLEDRTIAFAKEAKESRYWLKLIDTDGRKDLEKDCVDLISEATELMNIFGAILRKSE